MKKEKKPKGKNVTVSQEAHKVMVAKSKTYTPKITLRKYINIINKLPAGK